MPTTALMEAIAMTTALLDREFRGRHDTNEAARHRLAEKLGVKENQIFRLQHRWREMKDVAGEVYRRLKIAHDEFCEQHEQAADRINAERLHMRESRENAHDHQPAAPRGGSNQALD